MRATAVLLALAGSALGQTQAAGGTRAAAGTAASAGAPSAPAGARIDVRGLALNAFPEISGFDRPKNIQGHKVVMSPHAKMNNSRAGFYKGWSWPRIPDLPQVKAVIAYTNRIVSRAEAARNPTGTRVPTAPGKLRPARAEDPELTRRIAALQANPGTETARDVLPLMVNRPERLDLTPNLGEGPSLVDQPPPGSRLVPLPGTRVSVVQGAGGVTRTITTTPVGVKISYTGIKLETRNYPPRVFNPEAHPEPKRPKVIKPSFEGTLVAPRGSMLHELNDYWGDDISCGPCPTADRGPLDPRLVDSFTMGAHQDALAGQENAPPPAPGTVALREGDLVSAARDLVHHLGVAPEDGAATRRLALVILLREVPESAEKSMLEAYRLDPSLAAQPISRDDLPQKADLRELVISAVNRANKTNTPQSWLMVSVLMQAQGRGENAARMVARARSAGLDPAIADAFDAQLARQ